MLFPVPAGPSIATIIARFLSTERCPELFENVEESRKARLDDLRPANVNPLPGGHSGDCAQHRQAVVEELRRLGAHVRATGDGFHVRGVPSRLRGGVVDARGDHRLAMLGAVAGVSSREGVDVRGAEVVETSFPGFFAVLEQLATTTTIERDA